MTEVKAGPGVQRRLHRCTVPLQVTGGPLIKDGLALGSWLCPMFLHFEGGWT